MTASACGPNRTAGCGPASPAGGRGGSPAGGPTSGPGAALQAYAAALAAWIRDPSPATRAALTAARRRAHYAVLVTPPWERQEG